MVIQPITTQLTPHLELEKPELYQKLRENKNKINIILQ